MVRRYFREQRCRACNGQRLRPESRAVVLAGKSIVEVTAMTVAEASSTSRPRAQGRARPDRRRDPQGDQRAARLPARRRARLPDARPRGGDAVGRRGAAHPAGVAARLRAVGRDVRARRAVDRPAPARQPAAHRARCGGCATSATACSSSSTTTRPSRPPTTSSTSARAPAACGGRVVAAGHARGSSGATRRRSPGAFLSGAERIEVPGDAPHAARASSTVKGAREHNLQERRRRASRSACWSRSPACRARASRR